MTIQQAEVIWVGSWLDPLNGLTQAFSADAVPAVAQSQADGGGEETDQSQPQIFQGNPDIVILSMTVQEALAVKFAFETGVEIDLALRSQGDRSVFITTNVSLPQIVEQGILAIPEPGSFGLEPRLDFVPTPGVPDIPPNSSP
jgi:hypothetical protein